MPATRHVYKKSIPRIVVIVTRFLIFVGAYLSVIVFVLNQSILSFVALGGLLSAGLTFALGELIVDAFSGVILETESLYQVNDWIKTHDGDEGKVVQTNWRTVVLQSEDDCLIVVPHRTIAQGFVNYSKPDRSYWDGIEVNLDQRIPVERAERILKAALLDVSTIYHKKCEVTAMGASEKGVTYEIRYKVPDMGIFRQVRHDVVESVTRHLHDYGIKVCEYLGEYGSINQAISQERPLTELAPLGVKSLMQKVDFLSALSDEALDSLSQLAICHTCHEGEKIVHEGEEGQSMFLIGEGMVEVSIAYTNNAGVTKEKKLFHLSYPDYFGEMALLLNEKRTATVTAITTVVVYEISQGLLKSTLNDNPEMFRKMVKLAKDKLEKNKLAKAEMEKIKEKKIHHAKGLLTNIKKFFK